MIGSIVATIIIVAIVIYLIKSLIKETNYQTWLNILLVTVIMLTVIMSIFMLLNKTNNNGNNQTRKTQALQEQKTKSAPKNPQENVVEVVGDIPPLQEGDKDIAEMNDDELSLLIAENYLILKNSYEKLNNGKDGSAYAKNKIIEEYELTQQEWNDLYNRLSQQGYLKRAAQNLKENN